MRASTWLGMLVLLVGAGLACWFVLGSQGDSAEDLLALEEQAPPDATAGPVLSGQARSRTSAADLAEGRFEIPVKVVDAKGAPLVGVRVSARRQGDAWASDDPRRWFGHGARELARVMQSGPGSTEPWPLGGEATSGEGGLATLVVSRRGSYQLRAEPEAPRVGTTATWLLNDKPPTEPAVVRVLDGSPLKGRVVDATGRGVEAALTAYRVGGEPTWASDPLSSDRASGAFLFPGVPAGKVQLGVLLPGRMSFLGPTVTAPHDGEVLIRIPEGVPLLGGVVRGGDGAPVAGAQVAATVRIAQEAGAAEGQVPADARYFASTDAEGAFQILGPFGGTLAQLEAAATGYVPHSSQPPLATWSGLELAAGRESRVEIVLYQGGVIEGRVLEAGTGAPLAGAEVQAHPSAVDGRMTRPPLASGVSDAQGRYRIPGAVVGRSLLLVRHPSHFLPAQEALRTTGNRNFMWDEDAQSAPPPAALLVFVEREGQRVARDIELTPGIRVTGQVLDAEGKPVQGAEVRAAGQELGFMAWQWGLQYAGNVRTLATSGADGRFEIPGLAPRADWVLYAVKAPLVGEPSAPLQVRAGAAASEVVLRLAPGGVLAGRVIDGEGKPVEGAQLWVQVQDQRGAETLQGRSREDGSFRIEGVPAAPLWITAQSTRGGGHANQQLERLGQGEVREGIELKIAGGSATVTGVLVDEQGKPAAQVQMMASSGQGVQSQTMTSKDGAFRLEGLPAGAVTLFAWNAGQRVQLEQVTAPASDLRLTWKQPPSAVIEGLVVDAQGRPVPICRVQLRVASAPRQDGIMMPVMMGNQGELVVNGWFRRLVQGAGPYEVVVSAPQDGQGRPLNLRGRTQAVADATASPVTIRLEPGLEIAGRVVDGVGRGVAQVRVSAQGVSTSTDDEGAFSLGGLNEGAAAVQARPRAPLVTPAPVSATVGDRDVVIRLVTGLPVAGQLVRADGQPIKNGWVQVSWQGTNGNGNLTASPDAEGRFRVEGVPPDTLVNVQVQVWNENGSGTPPRTIEGVRAGTEDLRIELGRGVSVSGTALDSDGKPLKEAWVQVSQQQGEKGSSDAYTDIKPDGRFEMQGLEPGTTVKLTLYLQSGGTVGEPVTVQAPASGVRLVLPPRLLLRGQLRGSLGGAKWRVWAWTEGQNRKNANARQVDAQGRFTIENVIDKGPWRIAASAPDDDRYALSQPVEAGGADVLLDLRAGRSIEGVVLAHDGSPAGGAHVNAHNQEFGAHATCDARGEFRVRGLPPGTYTLMATGTVGGQHVAMPNVEDGATGVRVQFKAPASR